MKARCLNKILRPLLALTFYDFYLPGFWISQPSAAASTACTKKLGVNTGHDFLLYQIKGTNILVSQKAMLFF